MHSRLIVCIIKADAKQTIDRLLWNLIELTYSTEIVQSGEMNMLNEIDNRALAM